MAPRTSTKAVTLQQEIEAHQFLTNSINMLSDKIEKTESDFVGHLKKVEDRLDQIVDLTKTVAVLQQQSTQQNDQITELRTQHRESANKVDSSITRIHTRLDEIQNHQRDRFELHSKETDIKVEAVKTKADLTDKEFKQWLNRGWGAWAVGVLVFGSVQTAFYRWIDGIEKEKVAVIQQLNTTSATLDKHTQQIESISISVKDLVSTAKKNEQMIADSERQLDILRNNLKK